MALYQTGDKKALDYIIESNIRIVYKIANKYKNMNKIMDVEDLIQVGTIGLMKAAEKYDFNNEKKAKFITYAVHYINRYIQAGVNGRGSKGEANNKFNNNCTSLNTPVGEGEAELGDFIEGEDYSFENIEEKIYLSQIRKELEKTMIDKNTLREREILKLRYGWNSAYMTLKEIGDIFSLRYEKVREIESVALRKLRHSTWARVNIKEFLELGYIDDDYKEIFRNRGCKF